MIATMRKELDADRVRALMRALGRGARGPGRVYLEPHLLRYPALDAEVFRSKVEAVLAEALDG
jgi:hypothetical protein